MLISKDVFYYANPFLVNLDGVRGKLFSKRLHHALTNFVTNYGQDSYTANEILLKRFGCQILDVDYENLTKGITDENQYHFQEFIPSEIVSIINMLEELPEGFHVTEHLNFLIRRINGMPHPLYPDAAAVSWCVDNGYIEFMEKAFGGNNEDFETLRLILHEKTHFLWEYVFSDEIKNDWIEIGGWYPDPNAPDGWSTTKDVEFVSAYSHAHNPNEDMAESVAFYLKNPDKLMSRSPEKYEFICNRIMHGTRYISKIPDHLTFEVLNLYPDYDYPGKIKSLRVSSEGSPDEDKLVTVEIELNDEEGFNDEASSAIVRIYSPEFICDDGTKGSQEKDIWMYPSDNTGHRLKGSVQISKYSKSGHWTAGDIIVNDTQGNQRFEGRNDCVFDLYINNPLEDIQPPKYEGDLCYILSDSIVGNHKMQNLQVRFKVSDNIGFSRILCRLQLPGSTYSQDYDGMYDENTGEGIVNIPITEYFREGDYYINHIYLKDKAGNNIWYTFSKDENDYPIQYIHISTSDPDTTVPEIDLNRITVFAEPTHPEAPDGETLVTISFYGRDDKSGIGRFSYRLRDPQGIDHFEYFYHRNFYSLYFDGDPSVWEHYLIKVILPKGSVPGIWGLSQMTVADKAFNELTYNFVETLIFEPDNDSSDYVLFADISEDVLSFCLDYSKINNNHFKWRVIHEEYGYELTGIESMSNSDSGITNTQVDISSMPAGDIILITEIMDDSGTPITIKTKRLFYNKIISVESIDINQESILLKAGESISLIATVSPEDATDKTLEWTSSEESVATVDSEGNVKATGIGTATIRVASKTDPEVYAECYVTVIPVYVESIILDPSELHGEVGEEFAITATVVPENASNLTLEWSSSDSGIAAIKEDGIVMLLKEGGCEITAKATDGSGVHATCIIDIVSSVDEFLLEPTVKIYVFNTNGLLIREGYSKEIIDNLDKGVYIIRQGKTIKSIIVK